MSLAPIRVTHPGTDLLELPSWGVIPGGTVSGYSPGIPKSTITKTVQVIVETIIIILLCTLMSHEVLAKAAGEG